MSLYKLFLISLILISTNFTHASEQKLFYNLHQATSLIEQNNRKKCNSDSNSIIRKYLIQADKELANTMLESKVKKSTSLLEPFLHKTWTLYKEYKENKLSQLEISRAKLHEKAKKMNLFHDENWYKETEKICSSNAGGFSIN
jgi:hypothetical protein